MGNTRLPFLKAIPVFNQVLGIAVPLVLSNLGFGEGIDLGVLIMFSYILNLFIYLTTVFAVERTICRQLRWKDGLWAMLCGVAGAIQQILSVINFGLVSPTISSTVAMVVPIAVVFLDSLSSILSKKKKKVSILSRSSASKGVAVLIWGSAALVSHPKTFEGPIVIRLHGGHTKPINTSLIQDHPSWANTIGAIALCFAGSAPIATWCTNALKENMINPKLSYSFSVSTLCYFFGLILAGIYAMYCDWKNDSSELVSFTTLKVVECMMIVISTGLTAGSTWLVQQKGPSYAAPFAYIYLLIEVIAIPLALDGKLYLRSVIGAVLLLSGIFVYNFWDTDHEKEANNSVTSEDQGMGSQTDDHGITIVLEK